MKTLLTVLYIIIVLVVYVVYYTVNKRSYSKQLRAENGDSFYTKNNITPVLIFAVAFGVYSIIGIFDRISDASVNDIDFSIFILANLCGFVCFIIGYGQDNSNVKKRKMSNPIKTHVKLNFKLLGGEIAILVCFLAVLIIFRENVVRMIVNFGSGRNYSDYSVRAERSAFTGLMKALGSYFSLFIFFFPFYRIYTNRKVGLIDCVIFLIYFSWAFFSGDRTTLILIVLMVVVLINERLKPFNMKFLIIAAVFGMFALIVLGHLRRYNSLGEMIEFLRQEGISSLLNIKSSGEFRNTTGTLLSYIKRNDSVLSFGYFGVYITELLVWIPTFLFPNRPLPLAEQYMLDFYPDAPAGTGHGWFILTDGYMAFGVIGVAVEMLIYGWLMGKVYRKFFANKENPVIAFLYAYFLLYVFYSVRSSMFLTIKNYIISVFPVILLYLVFKKNFKEADEG